MLRSATFAAGSPHAIRPALSVPGATQKVRFPGTLGELRDQARALATDEGAGPRSIVAFDRSSDSLVLAAQVSGSDPKLPLRLGALNRAFDEIETRQIWLLDRDPVSIYTDRKGNPHIDVVNFGGFELSPEGKVLSSSVNPW